MTPARLVVIGRALFGSAWYAPLAEFCDVRRDSVRDWSQGRREVPQTVGEYLEIAYENKRALMGSKP